MTLLCSDKPIEKCKEDLLNRKKISEILSDVIYSINNSETYTIGLCGSWGSGKTSFINMLVENIETQNTYNKEKRKLWRKQENKAVLVVRFEPWNIVNNEILFNQFFNHLALQMKSKGDMVLWKIGSEILKYSAAFKVFEPNKGIKKFLFNIGMLFSNRFGEWLQKGVEEKDIFKQKEKIVKILRKSKKKILIIIDDIDRLSSEQIRQVFQLVVSVANFPNVTYLLSFDKAIVVDALKDVQKGDGEEYLEKIIQIPIMLPDASTEDINRIFFSKLEEVISEFSTVRIDQKYWEESFDIYVAPFISNVRFINRLCNVLKFKLTAISSEVDFVDLMAISILELTNPNVYDWVKQNKNTLTSKGWISKLKLKTIQENYEYFEREISALTPYGKLYSIEDVLALLGTLFPVFGDAIGKNRVYEDKKTLLKNSRIGHEDKFDRFFSLDINADDLKMTTIDQITTYLDSCEIAELLERQDKGEACHQILKEIEAAGSALSKERIIVLAKALFYSSPKLKTHESKGFSLGLQDIAEMTLYNLLENLSENENYELLSEIINAKTETSMMSVANIINMIELGYGRLAANGTERGFKKIISLEQLVVVENIFMSAIREMLKVVSLFDFADWRMIKYLIKNFDCNFYDSYINESLKQDKNVLRFITEYTSKWIGSNIEYEVSNKNQESVSDEFLLETIKRTKENGEFFNENQNIKIRCCAYYLCQEGKTNYKGCVTQEECEDLLCEWQTFYEVEKFKSELV